MGVQWGLWENTKAKKFGVKKLLIDVEKILVFISLNYLNNYFPDFIFQYEFKCHSVGKYKSLTWI